MNINPTNTPIEDSLEYSIERVNTVEGMRAQIRILMENGVTFRSKIETAKTSMKRDMYKKKLKKNNEKLFHALVLLETLSPSNDISFKDVGEAKIDD